MVELSHIPILPYLRPIHGWFQRDSLEKLLLKESFCMILELKEKERERKCLKF